MPRNEPGRGSRLCGGRSFRHPRRARRHRTKDPLRPMWLNSIAATTFPPCAVERPSSNMTSKKSDEIGKNGVHLAFFGPAKPAVLAKTPELLLVISLLPQHFCRYRPLLQECQVLRLRPLPNPLRRPWKLGAATVLLGGGAVFLGSWEIKFLHVAALLSCSCGKPGAATLLQLRLQHLRIHLGIVHWEGLCKDPARPGLSKGHQLRYTQKAATAV